jgi:hypothetical protein
MHRVDHHHAARQRRPLGRRQHRHPSAHGMARQQRRLAQRLEQADQVVAEGVPGAQVVRLGGRRRQAVAALVGRDDAELAGERRQQPPVGGRVEAGGVREHQQRPRRRPVPAQRRERAAPRHGQRVADGLDVRSAREHPGCP